MADFEGLISASRTSRTIPLFVALLHAAAVLLMSFVLWRVWDENQTIRAEQRCRAELAADDSRAMGGVVLVVAQSLRPTPATPADFERLAAAAQDLQRTQERRARADQLCT